MCPVCNTDNYSVIRKYHSAKPIFQQMSLAKCNVCGMVFATPMPSDEVLHTYNASYFMAAHGGIPQDIIAQSFFSAIAGIRMRHIQKYIQQTGATVKRVLEIGPGTGVFAKKWITAYPGIEYAAVETDASCYSSLAAMGVTLCNPSSDNEAGKPVDLVVMSHVLEHVSHPAEFLTENTISLKKDGVIFIEVPCNDWEHKPEDEPHLLFFDKKPMMQLMTSLGFKNIQLSYHGQKIEDLKAKPSGLTFLQKVKNKLIQKRLYKLAALFYTGDRTNLSSIEQAVIIPFEAYKTSEEPAWWLRVVAQKG